MEAIRSIGDSLGSLWFLVLSLWGGTVSYLSRVRNDGRKFKPAELIAQWATSGFAGLITAYICAELGVSFYMTAILTGMAGHMGAGALGLIEGWAKGKITITDARKQEKERDDNKR